MARQVRDASLETRTARSRLKIQGKPYWKSLDHGLHVGYRKRAESGTWVVRRLNQQGRYNEVRLGIADDTQDANGTVILSFWQAQETARKWFIEQTQKEQGLESHSGPYTVADAMRDYMAHYSIEGKGISNTHSTINAHILPTFGTMEVCKLTTKKITDWHHELPTKPARLRTRKLAKKYNTRAVSNDPEKIRGRRSTANRILTIFKVGLNYAWREGKVASDTAWRRVKPFRNVAAPIIRYLSEEECTRLINACGKEFRKIVQGALLTGCRYMELARLTVADFNPDSGTIFVKTSKSGKSRHVVLTDEGKTFFIQITAGKQSNEIIFTQHNGLAWGESHQSRPLHEACKNAVIIPAVSFHILRHTHGSLLAMRGVPLPVIAKQLGHADTRMTEKHYAHLSPSYVAETIRQHFPTLGIVAESNVVTLVAATAL